MKKRISIAQLLLVIWMVVMVLAVVSNVRFAKTAEHPYYEKMLEASSLTKKAFDTIKQYKLDNGMPIVSEDKLKTGLIGEEATAIFTTPGNLHAKRTTCNPNWAAVIIDYFYKANLKSGDQVVFVFSGSFPGLNIAALAAAEVFGLNTAVMASIGASSYGATDPDFTFFDMMCLLNGKDVLKDRLDYVSFGGGSDTGNNFHDEDEIFWNEDLENLRTIEEIKSSIKARIDQEGVNFIYEPDFSTNIEKRIEYLRQLVPDAKFLLNVGGSSVGIGVDAETYIDSGFQDPTTKMTSKLSSFDVNKDNWGLIQYFLTKQIPVASMLNIRGLASDYGLAYDPDVMPAVGDGEIYLIKSGNLTITIIAIVVSVAVAVFYSIYKRKLNAEEGQNERNYILC
ncbi:MAG: poly-gamma-glutamate system protein [Clostridia bacterium]|nr:poly-gamma-glutamate system protein [Clostridia bacterium]